MASRQAFLVGIGASGVVAAATGPKIGLGAGKALEITKRNIIIPGRGGTAYLANLPLWTPKEALHHPATASLNRLPRFTSRTLRQSPRLLRAMSERDFLNTVHDPNYCKAGQDNCGHPTPPPTPPPRTANLSAVSRTSFGYPRYYGTHYTARTGLTAIDPSGAHYDGYEVSTDEYVQNTMGQNPLHVIRSNAQTWGQGAFQYGTTTITPHPSLPMVRYRDPVYGSGVVYADPATGTWAYGSTLWEHTFTFGKLPTPVPNLLPGWG